jgi:hypothetical protein
MSLWWIIIFQNIFLQNDETMPKTIIDSNPSYKSSLICSSQVIEFNHK